MKLVLVDTNVWIDHFQRGNNELREFLQEGRVLTHPFVIGELSCGVLKQRQEIIELLLELPEAGVIDDLEFLSFVDQHRLYGRGIGLVDVHLISSCRIENVDLWTLDKRLLREARRLKVSFK